MNSTHHAPPLQRELLGFALAAALFSACLLGACLCALCLGASALLVTSTDKQALNDLLAVGGGVPSRLDDMTMGSSRRAAHAAVDSASSDSD